MTSMGFLDSRYVSQYGPRGFGGGGSGSVVRKSTGVIMGDGTRDDGNRNDPKTDEAALSARLQHLGERLTRNAAGRPAETDPGAGPRSDASAMARGLRLSTELVAGVLVGAGIGWMIDYGLGISPWGFIVFLLLGFAAGVMNVMRVAGVGPGVSSGRSSPTSVSRIGASSDERDRAGPRP